MTLTGQRRLTETKQELSLFVIMPNTPELDDVFFVGIAGAAEKIGLIGRPPDSEIPWEDALEEIYNQIGKADYIIADLSFRDPKILYMAGYAYALGKPLVLIARNEEDIPSGLKQRFLYFAYAAGQSWVLRQELKLRLRWLIDNAPSRFEVPNNVALLRRYKKELPCISDKTLVLKYNDILRCFDVPVHPFDVFLSYSKADEEYASRLHNKISSSGLRVYFAKKELAAGDPFTEEIREALINSYEIWVLVTPNSLKSEWVTTEWGAGWVLKKRVVPILLRCRIEELPERLQSVQCADYHEIEWLIQDLHSRLGGQMN